MNASERLDLVQDVTSDCSVVASLCASAARAEKGHSAIISSIFHPYDSVLQLPVRSKNGKYIFRLHFNGCWRKVVIDDRLPASTELRTLHVLDRNNPGLLWPALLEKAYLKIRGGYDFPGSNSGSDLWVLTGKISKTEERMLGLVSEHDYAVVDLQERDGRGMFLVKNPWSEAGGGSARAEKGPAQSIDDDDDQLEHSNSRSGEEPKSDRDQRGSDCGAFWMNISDVFQHFEALYLNWNPGLFSYKQDVHFSWDLTQRNGQWASFGHNPQYRIHSKAKGTIWLILSRHLKSASRTTGQDENDVPTAGAIDTGFISIYLYHGKGNKVYLPDGPLIRGPYVDSLNTLLKFEASQNALFTVVVSEQELHRSSHNFTLSAFSLQSLSILEANDRYRRHTVRSGGWTSATAGGNASSPYHSRNPQFSMDLPGPSDLCLLLELDSGESPVHVKLMRTNGKSVGYVMARDIVGDSGEYRKGHAFVEVRDVPVGRYTIICSTFEQGQVGKFTLRIGTMIDCKVERLTTRPAGRFISKLPTASFGAQVERVWASVRCSRLTRLSLIAQSRGTADMTSSRQKPSDMPLKVFLELGQGSMKQILAVSSNDEFSNGYYSVQIDGVDIQPLMCAQPGIRIVLERAGPLDPTGQEGVDIEVYSDATIEGTLGKIGELCNSWEQYKFV
ncbi:MAG: hypothetical protein Q9166_001817 [cf. Caloplaca sp. 2 TL-2023]